MRYDDVYVSNLEKEVLALKSHNEELKNKWEYWRKSRGELLEEYSKLQEALEGAIKENADLWRKYEHYFTKAKAFKSTLELVARINHQYSDEMIAEIVERVREVLTPPDQKERE